MDQRGQYQYNVWRSRVAIAKHSLTRRSRKFTFTYLLNIVMWRVWCVWCVWYPSILVALRAPPRASRQPPKTAPENGGTANAVAIHECAHRFPTVF